MVRSSGARRIGDTSAVRSVDGVCASVDGRELRERVSRRVGGLIDPVQVVAVSQQHQMIPLSALLTDSERKRFVPLE
jgi:hypothetical protein